MARLMPSWRSLPQTGTVSDCAGDTARFAITCSPSSTIPRWQPTTTEANGNCAPPQPIARSPAPSVPTGAPTCSPPSAPLSELPHAEASTPIRPFARPYAGSPFSNRVEQIRRWQFVGPASLTLNFMALMYSGSGEGGKALISELIYQITGGDLGKRLFDLPEQERSG